MLYLKNILIGVIAACFIITLTITAQTWTSLQGPPKAQNVRAVATDSTGSRLYACDKTILFKSTNGAASWQATGSELQAPRAVTCRPESSDIVIVGVNHSLYRSADGGNSWNLTINNSNLYPLCLSVSLLNSEYMYLGRRNVPNVSSIMYSPNAGGNWNNPVTKPGQTDLYDIAPSPDASYNSDVWACGSDPDGTNEGDSMTTRGVWRSTDKGGHWTAKGMNRYNVCAIAVKPGTSPPLIFVGTQSGEVFSSINLGVTWVQTTSIDGSVSAIRIRNASEIYVATEHGIFKSTDNGGNWTNLMDSGDNGILAFTIAPGNQNLMYATTANTVWKSTNAGSSWVQADNGLGRMPISSIEINGSNYWTVSNQDPIIAKYDGSAWSESTKSSFSGEHIIKHPNYDYIYASGAVNPSRAKLYRNTDGSLNFPYYFLGNSLYGSVLKGTKFKSQDSSYIYVYGKDGTNANLYKISNFGAGSYDGYTVGGSPLHKINDLATISGSGVLYYALDTIGVYRSPDGPGNGTQKLGNLTANGLTLNPSLSEGVVYAATLTGLYKTTDAGSNWTQVRTDALKRVILSPGFPNSTNFVVVVKNNGSAIYYSFNGGTTWTDATGDIPTPVYELRTEAGNATTLYAATDQGAYKVPILSEAPILSSPADSATNQALNTTLSWNSISGANAYHFIVATDQNFNNKLYDFYTTSTSYQLTNLSFYTWYYWKVYANNLVGDGTSASSVRIFQTIPGITLDVAPANNDGSGCEPKTSDCHPKLSWTGYGLGQNPTYHVYRYACQYGVGDCNGTPQLLADTNSTWYVDQNVWWCRPRETPYTTFYYYVTSGSVTSNKVAVNSNQTNKLAETMLFPRKTGLGANYPNPFNPSTTIDYALSEAEKVSLKIYNVLGQEIKILVNEYQDAGYKSITFTAGNLPSGVYFYRLQAGKFVDVKKMLITR